MCCIADSVQSHELYIDTLAFTSHFALRSPTTFRQVAVQAGAGAESSFPDGAYARAGARIVDGSAALGADVVLKVSANYIHCSVMVARGCVFLA